MLAGLLLGVLYVVGTVGILLVLPVKTIGLTAGLVQTFKAIFGASPSPGSCAAGRRHHPPRLGPRN